MAEQKASNVHWHEGDITRAHRAEILGHRGATLWFTGLSGSGKSTVAVELEGMLSEMGVLCYRLDGDNFLYATGDHTHLRRFRDNNMFPVFVYHEVVFDHLGNMHSHELPEDLQVLFDQSSSSVGANQRMLFYHRGNAPDFRLGSALACIIAWPGFPNGWRFMAGTNRCPSRWTAAAI